MNHTETTQNTQPLLSGKTYSAREAMEFVKEYFSTPDEFRKFLKVDYTHRNLFNVKIEMFANAYRYFIKGEDLISGLATLAKHPEYLNHDN